MKSLLFSVGKASLNDELEASRAVGTAAIPQAVRHILESQAVSLAIARGQRDMNAMANMIFFARHPERRGKKLGKSEPHFNRLAGEWLQIRDQIVRPLLSKAGQTAPPPGQTPPSRHPPPAFPSRSLVVLKQKIQEAINQGQITPDFDQQMLKQSQSRILRPLPKILSGWGWRKASKGFHFHQGLDLAAAMRTRITYEVRVIRPNGPGPKQRGFFHLAEFG